MRIAVVTTSYPSHEGDPSGHFVEAEVRELERLGHTVLVTRPRPGGAFGWPGAAVRIRERPTRAVEAAGWLVRAHGELRRFRPDRIVAHWCLPSAIPVLGIAAELELVSHGGDVRLVSQLPASVRTAVVRALVARASRWRFVSLALRRSLEATLPPEDVRALARIATIAPGLLSVPDVREDAQAKRSTVAGRRLYVCAGRLVASKRVDKVIDYVATRGALPAARLLVVLGDGPERPHLERLARARRIDARFLGTTTRREALGWIGAADELVHASRVEGLSTVIREAEHLGVPVTLIA